MKTTYTQEMLNPEFAVRLDPPLAAPRYCGATNCRSEVGQLLGATPMLVTAYAYDVVARHHSVDRSLPVRRLRANGSGAVAYRPLPRQFVAGSDWSKLAGKGVGPDRRALPQNRRQAGRALMSHKCGANCRRRQYPSTRRDCPCCSYHARKGFSVRAEGKARKAQQAKAVTVLAIPPCLDCGTPTTRIGGRCRNCDFRNQGVDSLPKC